MSNSMSKLQNSLSSQSSSYLLISLDRLVTGEQPRTFFDDERIVSLANSILSAGKVLQNLVVSHYKDDLYLLATGERRLRACRYLVDKGHLQFSQVPCVISSFDDDKQRFLVQVIENSARDNLHPFDLCEQAVKYRDLIDCDRGWKKRFCEKTGFKQNRLSDILALESFDSDFKEAVLVSGISSAVYIKKLYLLEPKDFVISLLLEKHSFSQIVADVSALTKSISSNTLADDAVSKVKLGSVDKEKLDLFYKFLREHGVDVGDDLCSFIDDFKV